MGHNDRSHRVDGDGLTDSFFHLTFQIFSFFLHVGFDDHPFIFRRIVNLGNRIQSYLISFFDGADFAQYVDAAMFYLEDRYNL